MIISVGDIAIDLHEEAAGAVPIDLLPWVAPDATPSVFCVADPDVPADDPARCRFDSGFCWRVDDAAPGIRLTVLAGETQKTVYHTLTLDETLTRGRVHLREEMLDEPEPPFLLRQPLHELWTSFLLMRGRGLLVHGLGVLHEGRVTIFAGKSGVGKSTLGGVFAAEGMGEILSDDRLILRAEPEGIRVYGTPWHGEARFASPSSGMLGAICFLRQAPSCLRTPLSAAEVAARLFASCFVAGWPREDGLRFTLNRCAETAMQIPGFELSFTPDRRALHAMGFL